MSHIARVRTTSGRLFLSKAPFVRDCLTHTPLLRRRYIVVVVLVVFVCRVVVPYATPLTPEETFLFCVLWYSNEKNERVVFCLLMTVVSMYFGIQTRKIWVITTCFSGKHKI